MTDSSSIGADSIQPGSIQPGSIQPGSIQPGSIQPVGGAPDVCRVTVLASGMEVDLTLPATAETGSLLPGIVAVIEDHRRRGGVDVEDRDASPPVWTLATLIGDVLPIARTLTELGIRDGALLVLHDSATGPASPVFDDVIYGVAQSADTPIWDALSARVLACAAIVSTVVVAAAALLLAPGDGGPAAATAVGLTAVLTVTGCTLGRLTDHRGTALTLCTCAVLPALVTGILVVPQGRIGPDLALASALAVTCSVVSLRFAGVGRSTFTAIALIAAWTCAAALASGWAALSLQDVGAAVAGLAILAFTWAPRMSMMHSRVPLPPVPVPGGPSGQDDGSRAVASYEDVRAHAVRARQYLTGYVVALSVAAASGALACAVPDSAGTVSWVHASLAAATAVVLVLRGRTYADRVQAGAGIVAGMSVLTGLAIGAIVVLPGSTYPVVGLCCAAAVVAVLVGIVAPGRVFTPVTRRAAELAEFALIVSIVPLVCWALDLFALVRGL